MTLLGELRLPARRESLRVLSYFMHGIAHRLELSENARFELELVAEEAATNIIEHAYPARAKGDMLVRAELDGEHVQLTLQDWGEPLQPDAIPPFDINAPLETRTQGGMGLHFIHTLSDTVERIPAAAEGQPNVLRLRKRIERSDEPRRAPNPLQELNAMHTVSAVMISNPDLDNLLRLILSKLVNVIDADRGTLYLIDEARGELWSRVLQSAEGELSEIRLKIGKGVAGYVAASGQTLNIPDAYADPRFDARFDRMTGYRTRSILAAPMVNPQQKIIGVVQLLNKRGGPFTQHDERLLAAMTAQAAISIENARLYQQEIQQRVLQREMQMARNIQSSFLPDTIPQPAGWEIGALWCPARGVAGDFYDFYRLPDGRLAVMIADVSGKGVPAALFMALSVTVLRFGVMMNLTPDEVARRANVMILDEQRSRMFATAFLAYLAPENGALEYTLAGHNPPLLYRAGEGRCDYLPTDGVAFGIFSRVEYAAHPLTLEVDDVLVLYTDGITEAINAHEEEFGEGRLRALVAEGAHMPAQALAQHILEQVQAFTGEQELEDDATLVVLKRRVAAPISDLASARGT